MQTVPELMDLLRQSSINLVKMSEQLDYPWNPEEKDKRRLHNMYVRSIVTCYVSKVAQLSAAIVDSVDDSRFLIYAMAGRSLIESVATLRYYLFEKYMPLLDRKILSAEDMKTLLNIDDQHLRGSRFDWDSFLNRRYNDLSKTAAQVLAEKKRGSKNPTSSEVFPAQINVLTCIENWGRISPEVIFVYNMFCDLVHPNIGSSFMVASLNENKLYFSMTKGSSVGVVIYEQSLPLLLSITIKPFGDYLLKLILTIYHEDEFELSQVN